MADLAINLDTLRKYSEGGVVEQPMQRAAPPGALQKEVADDVDVKASQGEYILPANVVRFLGLDRIEKMVEQAKAKLQEFEDRGRMGGEDEETLPFPAEELQVAPEEGQEVAPQGPQRMATGGLVTPDTEMSIDPTTGLPTWMVRQNTAATGPTSAPVRPPSQNDASDRAPPTGLAGAVEKWSPKDFSTYSTARNSVEQGFGQGLVSMIPGGKAMAKLRQNTLEESVPKHISSMLETGQDLQGNPLSEDQKASLEAAKAKITSEPVRGFGFSGMAKELAAKSGLISKKEAKPTKVVEEKPKESLITRQEKTKKDAEAESKAKDKASNSDKDEASKDNRSKDDKDKTKK